MNKLEKVYRVQFVRYTNYMRNTVATDGEIGERQYLNVGENGFLVKESDLNKYRKYGGGYKVVKLVGEMEVEDNDR